MTAEVTANSTRRHRRGRPKATRSDPAQALMASLNVVVDENKTLTAENARLKQVLEQIAKMLARASAAGLAMVEAAPSSPATRSGRRRERPARRRRAPVTNPESLERRRAALVRAREALAAKRAAQREASRT